MQPFEITTETNITNLPIKKRFQLMQKWAEDSGRKLTWKEAKYAYKEIMKGTIYINDVYQVIHCNPEELSNEIWSPQLKGKMDYLSIKRNDKEAIRSWSDFQEIKNMIIKDGKDRYALEIYPPEDRLVNTANQYHLWVMPKGLDLGFGFTKRRVDVRNGKRRVFVDGKEFTIGQTYNKKD